MFSVCSQHWVGGGLADWKQQCTFIYMTFSMHSTLIQLNSVQFPPFKTSHPLCRVRDPSAYSFARIATTSPDNQSVFDSIFGFSRWLEPSTELIPKQSICTMHIAFNPTITAHFQLFNIRFHSWYHYYCSFAICFHAECKWKILHAKLIYCTLLAMCKCIG